MAKRTSIVKHETDEFQGEGSFVVLSAMKVREVRELRRLDDDADGFEIGIQMLADHIIEWNWVDDEGESLPLPKDDPEAIGRLTNSEADFLSELLIPKGESDTVKN